MRVQSLEEALTFLRINLAAEGVSREATLALFRLFSNGVTPNLIFDRDGHRAPRSSRRSPTSSPSTVSVERGQTIIEPGTRVTPEQYEMLVAHREFLLHNGDVALNEGLQLFGRILLVLAMVMASVFYIRLEDPETMRSNGRLALLALVVILNLALVRATYWIGELPFFMENTAAASLLPYVAPTALAPLIVAILIDAGSAIFMALLISIFTGVIYGNRLDLLVITFLASMVGIFSCRAIRQRSRVVRAAGLGGLTVACFALLIGFADQLPLLIVLRQMAAGLAHGPAHRRGRRRPAAGARGPVQADHRHHAAGADGLQPSACCTACRWRRPAPTTTASSSPTSRRTPPTPSAPTRSSAASARSSTTSARPPSPSISPRTSARA